MEQRDIKSLTLEELKGELQAHGEKAFRAGQIYNWMHGKLASGFDEMSNLSKSLRELLKNEYEYTNLDVLHITYFLVKSFLVQTINQIAFPFY